MSSVLGPFGRYWPSPRQALFDREQKSIIVQNETPKCLCIMVSRVVVLLGKYEVVPPGGRAIFHLDGRWPCSFTVGAREANAQESNLPTEEGIKTTIGMLGASGAAGFGALIVAGAGVIPATAAKLIGGAIGTGAASAWSGLLGIMKDDTSVLRHTSLVDEWKMHGVWPTKEGTRIVFRTGPRSRTAEHRRTHAHTIFDAQQSQVVVEYVFRGQGRTVCGGNPAAGNTKQEKEEAKKKDN